MTKRSLKTLQQEAFAHYEQLFTHVAGGTPTKWTKEQELLLERLIAIKDLVQDSTSTEDQRILKIEHMSF